MPIIDDGLKSTRRAERAKLGPLRSLVVTTATLNKYEKSMRAFFQWMEEEEEELPTEVPALDISLCRFIENLWQEGESRSVASNVLAGFQNALPHLRRRLNGAWRLTSAWQKKKSCRASRRL